MTTCSDLKLSDPRHKGAYLGIFAINRKPRSWQQTFPMVSDSKWFETLQCLPFYKLDKKPLQIYSDRVRVLRQEAKLLAEVYIGNIAEVYMGTLQRCILGTGLFQIQRESLEARKLNIVRLRIPISNASWLHAPNVSNELVFFQPSTNCPVYNRHSWI